MTDTPLKPLPDSASENVPRRMVRPLTTRLLIALVAALIVTGCAFWSGYTTLRGPEGWVGLRRYVPMYIVSIQQDLTKYHEEHEAYPETLREMYEEESAKDNRMLTDEDYNRRITVYRHPVEYERTDSGWQITDFGADGKPGGVGLDADLVITCEMDRDQIFSEARNKKFHATFEQVQTARNDADLGSLFIESLVLGIVAFCCTLRAVNESKENHIVQTVVAAILITIAAGFIGGIITMLHSIATGH